RGNATGGDEQLFFHQAPPRSRFRLSVRNGAGSVNRPKPCNGLLLGYRAREPCRRKREPATHAVPRFPGLGNSLLLVRGRPEHGELVRNLELRRVEPEHGGRAPAAAAWRALLARALDHAATQEDALQVGRRDVVPERGGVELAQLRDRELRRRQREADVRVRELCAQALTARERDRAVVEGELRQP